MGYTVVWEMDAVDDRLEVMEFLFSEAGDAVASATDEKFTTAASLLSEHPFIGKAWEGMGRRLIMTEIPYFIFYDVDDERERVSILRVIHKRKLYP
ncbi:type II toxin-antitoxin system RelE/ParE family toxin [Shewanella sp. 10N.261.52.F9]|uniref:type II toxin-antitoxin system RelE/ParE family toxin n=1 Tax=Shewanella sp. 10N.261.52.F9 TaxID=3229684 RepID=UPI00354FD440